MIWTTWLLGVVLQFEGQRLSASASTCESRDQCLTESSALYKALVGFTYRTLEKLNVMSMWLLQAGLYFPPHRYAFLFFLSVKLGSVRELAAFSCHETAESDSENIASGNYWLKPINSMAPPSLVYRAMTPEGEISKLWLSCIVPRNLAKRGLFFCDKKNGT